MALKIIEGVVEEIGEASSLSSETGPAGTVWSFVRFGRGKRSVVTLERVMADPAMSKHVALKQAGRFALYPYDGQLVLCGFAGPAGIEIATREADPAAMQADVIRLPAKRKVLLGFLLIPTIIGLFFAFDMIKAGRATLREHPAPKRPPEVRVTRALKGQFYWPF